MKILIVSATHEEVAPTIDFLDEKGVRSAPFRYQYGALSIDVLITGLGIPATIYALMKYLSHNDCEQVINVGIAGSFKESHAIGKVCLVVKQKFGDLGVQKADGKFTDLFELGYLDPDQAPYSEGWLTPPKDSIPSFLEKVSSISVNKVSGQKPEIQQLIEKYDPDLESMEGAAVAYVCLLEKCPYLEVRAVSNLVEERKKENWDIPRAIQNLNDIVIEMLTSWKDISAGTPIPTQ